MNWPDVMTEITALLEGDADLMSVLGGAYIFEGQSTRPVRVPSIEWLLVGDIEEEVFNPITVQFDYWANIKDAPTIEGRLRMRLNRPGTFRVIGGIYMATLYEDGYEIEYPRGPGIKHKALRFNFIPLRRRAAVSQS